MELLKIASELEEDGPRDLFPMYDRQRTYGARRDYVETQLLKMIDADSVYLSEIMYYGGSIKDIVGDIILGTSRQDGSQVVQPPNNQIREHRVKILPLNPKKNITWKAGRRISRKSRILNRTIKGKSVLIDEPVMYEAKDDDTFSLPDAYRILKQSGVPIKMGAGRAAKQTKAIMVVEVPPWVTYGDEDLSATAKRPSKAKK